MLTESEVAELDSTLLPALERHHLRLLAHSLRTLQTIAASRHGEFPDRSTIEAWVRCQPSIAEDPSFLQRFVEELLRGADQLSQIAASRGRDQQPLALELKDLSSWATEQADRRLASRDLRGADPMAVPPQD